MAHSVQNMLMMQRHSHKFNTAKLLNCLLTVAFYGLSVFGALRAALVVQDKGVGSVLALVVGICVTTLGLVGLSLLTWMCGLVFTRLRYGPSFHKGDAVEIAKGEYQGRRATICGVVQDLYVVRVAVPRLEDTGSEDTEVDVTVHRSCIRKVP